jgi:hypothetical protein
MQPKSPTSVGESPVSVAGVVILGFLVAAASLLALYGLWRFWPAPSPATGSAPATARFSYFSWHLSLTARVTSDMNFSVTQ